MLIQCTFCHAQSKIPEDKEGAKVRCGKCGKVYVAEAFDPDAPEGNPKFAKKKSNPLTWVLAGGAVGIVAVIAFCGHDKAEPAPPVVTPQEQAVVEKKKLDLEGWESAPVKTVRDLYEAAATYNENVLKGLLDGPKLSESLAEKARKEDPTGAAGPAPMAFADMDVIGKAEFLSKVAKDLMSTSDPDAPAKWEPFEGKVTAQDSTGAIVQVKIRPRGGPELDGGSDATGGTAGAETRAVGWHLVRVDDKWKAWMWERLYTSAEIKEMKPALPKGVTKVKLDDGTALYQAEPRKLDHLADTPPEVRTKIDASVARMLDFSLHPKENNAAFAALVEIGKPAIPILLTQFYERRMTDETSQIQLQKVNDCLEGITGYDPGFTLMGGNDERRVMAMKAWFAWWIRKGSRFEEKAVPKDALEGLIQPTEREKKDIEAAKKKKAGGG
jgi:predicted Zn finger-like uncharacterized protein